MPLTLLCAARLHAPQLERHLELFEHMPEVERVIVVRYAPLSGRLGKVEHVVIGQASRPVMAARMYRAVTKTLTTQKVDWVLGFNPVPWGSIALAAARRAQVPVCLSIIGSDFHQLQHYAGAPFRAAVRSATSVTVTGERMAQGIERLGVAKERIFPLAHSVDRARFAPAVEAPSFDVVSVGRLVPLKRMDVLIEAVAKLKQGGLSVRVGIVGDGPERERLELLIQRLDVGSQVELLGFQDRVEQVLARAKLFALLSESEGLPFALMEALSAGLVPIVTPVGSIAEWVHDGKNGAVVPVGDVAAVANALRRLLTEPAHYASQRRGVAALEERLGFEHGVACWRSILGLEPRR